MVNGAKRHFGRHSALIGTDAFLPATLAAAIAKVVWCPSVGFAYNTLANIAEPVRIPSFVAYTVAMPSEVVALAK